MGSLASFDAPIVAYVLCVTALLGLVMGSFINCWAWRYMNGESVLKGRSHCTSCGHVLGLADLIPIISWLASGVLLFLSLTDLDDYLIPNGCILAAIAIRVVYLGVTFAMGTTSLDQIIYYAASGFGVGLVLVVIVLIADRVFGRDSMGGGDLKLYFVAGLYFGWQQCLLLVIISCIIGIVVAVVGSRAMESSSSNDEADQSISVDGIGQESGAESNGQAVEEKSMFKRMIPFGPSIAASCVIIMLVGEPLINWYLSFLA